MRWKNDAECAVLLTFDFDGQSMWESRVDQGNPDFGRPSVASMGEYGATAVPKLLDLLDEYDVDSGWFIPGITAERNPDLVERIHDEGHELGNHGYSHVNPATMSDKKELEEIKLSNEVFEELTGETPVGFRSPAGDLSDRTLNRLIELGFEYDSSLMGRDLPYFLEAPEGTMVELPFYWSEDDAPHFNFSMYPQVAYQNGMSNPSAVLDIWKSSFDACYEDGLLFHLVTHPQIIGRPHRRKMLEELVDYITDHSEAWVTTPREVTRYWQDTVAEEDRDVRSV
jgi:peptidoglycan/xylan/chitin deacetylase (PgdA/CDA1 family)